LATYAAIALIAAMLAVIFVRTRYDKLVPRPPRNVAVDSPPTK
jgi:hypothetical protein